MARKVPRWIQGAKPKAGALHRQLGYPSAKHIPPGLIRDIHDAKVGSHVRGHAVTLLMKRRVQFMINAQKRRGK